jgi:hypothetical protein
MPGSRPATLLVEQLAIVREMLGRLEAKLRERDSERVPKEEDRLLRSALQRIGDEQLTRSTLGNAVCVRGLTAPLPSGAWKQELAEEVDEVHRRAVARLETLERLSRSAVGRLLLRLQGSLWRIAVTLRRPRRLPSPEGDGDLHRPA